jgi:transposase
MTNHTPLKSLKERLKRPIEECLQEMMDDLDAKDAEIARLGRKVDALERKEIDIRGIAEMRRINFERVSRERDEARARIAKLEGVVEALRSVLSEDGVKEYLSAYVMGVELIDRVSNLEGSDT